jgi:hypothetical protein
VLYVVGNKIDLNDTRTVRKETAGEYAKSIGAAHFEVSAKTNEGEEPIHLSCHVPSLLIHVPLAVSTKPHALSLSSPLSFRAFLCGVDVAAGVEALFTHLAQQLKVRLCKSPPKPPNGGSSVPLRQGRLCSLVFSPSARL